MINIGDIYWLKQVKDISHPQVIIQIKSHNILVSSLTTNMNKSSMPGNVVLEPGEANLDKQSIVEVSKVKSLTINELDKYIGSLSKQRVNEILKGIRFLNNLLPSDRVK